MGKKAVSKFFYCNSIVLTIILAIITIVGAFASSTPISVSKFLPFIALGLSLLLLGNVIVAIYWMCRKRYWFIIPLLAIACNYPYITRILQFHHSDEIRTQRTCKIATFNANFFGKQWIATSTKEIAKYMKENRVDIICFQEYQKGFDEYIPDSIYQTFKEWHYRIIPTAADSSDHLQMAVFSRYPIKKSVFMAFRGTANCGLWCDIDIMGQTIRLFNLHLQTTSATHHLELLHKYDKESNLLSSLMYTSNYMFRDMSQCFMMRSLQALYIRKRIDESPHPVVVCGDFNSLPSSYTYKTILGKDLVDGFQAAGHGYMYTYRYLKHLFRIDYIFNSKKLRCTDYFSPKNEFHSDHNPVISTITF
jgi:endonuclease/exonuclease/phosphatase family metal-dependent hydrolase